MTCTTIRKFSTFFLSFLFARGDRSCTLSLSLSLSISLSISLSLSSTATMKLSLALLVCVAVYWTSAWELDDTLDPDDLSSCGKDPSWVVGEYGTKVYDLKRTTGKHY